MPNMSNVTLNSLFCLFKGEPGTRKSTAALSFPRPQYWFSWDRKMESLIIPMRNWGVKPEEVEYDDYTEWSKAEKKLKDFQVNCKFKTLIVDTITSNADGINKGTMRIKGEPNKVGGIPVNSIEDYKAEESALQDLVSKLKDIHKYHGTNVILIAHVIQREQVREGKTHMARTIVTAGKGIAQKIPGYCTEVYHFNIKPDMQADKEGNYALKTTHTGDDFARTSLPLPPEIVFGNRPLYDEFLLPVIQKFNPKPTTPFPSSGVK